MKLRNAGWGLILLICSGCGYSQYTTRVEYGYGEALMLADALANGVLGNADRLDAHLTSAKSGPKLYEGLSFSFDVMGGIFTALPEDHESKVATGFVVTPRVVYRKYDIKPYFSLDLGFAYADWESQGTDFNFVVGGDIGVMVPVPMSTTTSFTISYKMLHVSNAGMGNPNPGVNSDFFVFGIEHEF